VSTTLPLAQAAESLADLIAPLFPERTRFIVEGLIAISRSVTSMTSSWRPAPPAALASTCE
jgi:hypothetical protein